MNDCMNLVAGFLMTICYSINLQTINIVYLIQQKLYVYISQFQRNVYNNTSNNYNNDFYCSLYAENVVMCFQQ